MDSRYPSHEERRHRRPRRPHRGDQEDPEGHWHREHQYEDPEHSNQDIDPELESQSPSTGPTILPPGTSVSGYSRYMQTGQHPSYVSSAQQSYNPPSGGGKYDYSVYEYGTGQNAASSYQYDYGAGELQSPE
ncbi:hypothetical protein DRE_00947 [Drechslerella stenobrocha 248]|uniref:Uncharacterized protein n=1 Tax=Drechslerella stenobrocha 248 TaxID=1043628 RepID=W7HY70_9PEZI|nr:hypothetical protein DRE_00947 [Drechslerella stenobrocha 248]